MLPTPGLLGGLPLRSPPAVHGRAGRFCYDTMTLVGPGSWEAIRAAADAALTAADLVSARGAAGLRAVPAARATTSTRRAYGGSCYLNNAAIAAQALRAAGAGRVAVLDIDAHHGNGTQAIFYDRGRRLLRLAARRPGRGLVPALRRVRRRARDRRRARAPTATCRWRRAPATTAGSRRSDALRDDGRAPAAPTPSWSRSAWTPPRPTRRARCRSARPATARAGELIAALGARRSLIQEGGYDLPSLGPLVVAALTGAAEA